MAQNPEKDYLEQLVAEGRVGIRPYHDAATTVLTTLDFEKLFKRIQHHLVPIFAVHERICNGYSGRQWSHLLWCAYTAGSEMLLSSTLRVRVSSSSANKSSLLGILRFSLHTSLLCCKALDHFVSLTLDLWMCSSFTFLLQVYMAIYLYFALFLTPLNFCLRNSFSRKFLCMIFCLPIPYLSLH